MEARQKKILKALSLELRHLLEGQYDSAGHWLAGDLEQRLNAIGVWRERTMPADEMHLSPDDSRARSVVDAYLKLREEAGVRLAEAVAEFVRETAYTWANRLLALRCMEARELIDEVILQKEVYGGRSLEHHRLIQRQPELGAGEDDGLFAVLDAAFARQAERLPLLFDPKSPGVALRPSVAAIKRCVALLSGTEAVRGQEPADDDVFKAPDALGWAYQYWNTEEKDRVFETVRTKKGAKIEGADIIPATQLYTEDYMVKFLVQNSLGATWVGMKPNTKLVEGWEYFVRDADRAPVEKKPVREITFLDPACGSGHFLIEAFDLFFDMYKEDGEITDDAEICASILTNNLFGIDIDQRAVQISEAALWMRAAERCVSEGDYAFLAPSPQPLRTNLVATNIRLPRNKDHLREFLAKHPEDRPLAPALEAVFEALQHADELGSLLQLEEPVEKELKLIKQRQDEEASVPRNETLFEEMRRPVQTVLPVNTDDWDTWKTRTVERIREHFSEQAEAANLQEQFFGMEAGKGWKLFELLGRKYDVVAANPPYMGAASLSVVTKNYIEQHYSVGKRDLYSTFILRCIRLAAKRGRVAMITQQSWMFLRSFSNMRLVDPGKNSYVAGAPFFGILADTTIEALAHLGPRAFAEIGGEVVNTVMFTIANCVAGPDQCIAAMRVIGPKTPSEKAATILAALKGGESTVITRPRQQRLAAIPGAPICYWLSEHCLDLFVSASRPTNYGYMGWGISSSNNNRFLRWFWESQVSDRWLPHAKGGCYARWAGLVNHLLDWDGNGIKLKSYILERYPYLGANYEIKIRPYTFNSYGWTYSSMAAGCLGVRLLELHHTTNAKSPALFLDAPHPELGPALNSRPATYFLRAIASSVNIDEGYVGALPLPNGNSVELTTAVSELCVAAKSHLLSSDMLDSQFPASRRDEPTTLLLWMTWLSTLEGFSEHVMVQAYGLDAKDVSRMLDETGVPAAWFSLIAGYDEVPDLPLGVSGIPFQVTEHLNNHGRQELSPVELDVTRRRLRALYEVGSGAKGEATETEDSDINGDEEEAVVGARIPIPAETFLEELSQKLEIHPISVYWLLKEGIENEGWRCLPEERRITSDRLTVTILRLLGHRWPKQIEAGEPVPDWADPDGVIPLTENTSEQSLFARVRDRLAAEFENGNVEREFEEIMGKPLSQWLVTDFFGTHISQFKKRPIAWQLQIGKFNGRKTPAFACMAYYHKLTESFLPTMQSQYVRPLRQRLETELRGIENIPAASRTGDQTARRVELTALIDELNDFDSRLDRVTNSGFATAMLRQYAIDDAMLALKARWLKRLSENVVSGPLPGWQNEADKIGLHEDMSQWIGDALSHLDHFCAKVGPAAPDEKKLETDPTSADLAKLIAPKAKSMVSDSLKLACDVWWKTFDDVVLGPIKEQIKALNEEHKTLDAEHKILTGKEEPAPDKAAEFDQLTPTERADRVHELEHRMKQIKLEIKPLKDEQAEKTEKAKKLRTAIERWTCPQAETWEPWLAPQPLYDQISALDGQRQPPATVADFIRQESLYAPDINDGVRVNIAPIQKAGLLAADVLATKDLDKAIADRAEWRSDERRWVREGKLPQPGWWE